MEMTVFLDFDGVLTYTSHVVQEIRENPKKIARSDKHEMCSIAGYNLNQVLEYIYSITGTYPKIVVSSTWRISNPLNEIEEKMRRADIHCFEKGINKTDQIPGGFRGTEIQKYIIDNQVTNYIIIDDEVSDIKPFHKFDHIMHIENGWFNSGFHKKYIAQAKKKIDKLLIKYK